MIDTNGKSVSLKVLIALLAVLAAFSNGYVRAEADRPDANALFAYSYKDSSKKLSDSFAKGVNEIVQAIEQSKPVSLITWGPPLPMPNFDPVFGLPLRPLGCVVDSSVVVENNGRIAALAWYEKRGRYPVNSLKFKLVKSVPADLNWVPLTEGVPKTGTAKPLLYLTPAEKFGVRGLMFHCDGRNEIIDALHASPSPLSKWAYDAHTQTYFVDAVDRYTEEDSFERYRVGIGKGIGKGTPALRRPPNGLTWKKIEPTATAGLFVKGINAFPDIYFKMKQGEQRLGSWSDHDHRWQNSFWAYDAKNKIAWIKGTGPITNRKILQVNAASHQVMQMFDPPPEMRSTPALDQ